MPSDPETPIAADAASTDTLVHAAATLEILQVISRSRDDEEPVFDAILQKAAQLCGAPMASLNLLERKGTRLVLARHWGKTLEHYEAGITEWPLDGVSVPAQAVRESQIVHIEDLAETEAYKRGDPTRVRSVDNEGIRTFLAVPLMQGGKAIGCIALFRREVRPFAQGQITLVRTFAEQAMIAIENVREFRELQARLEREAATREILQVIGQSRDDVQPVLTTIVKNAARICQSPDVGLHLVNEARTHSRLVCALDEDKGIFRLGEEFDLNGPLQSQTAIREARTIHIPDVADDPLFRARDPVRVRLVEEAGVRSRLSVPLLKDGVAFGCINLNRLEVRPFTDDEIKLIETFAAQAVIAIENVRQFRELQTRLEREEATGEVLQVISRSRDDRQPVFDVILKNASRLCKAPLGFLSMANEERTHVRIATHLGAKPDFAVTFDSFNEPIDNSELLAVRVVSEAQVIRMDDIADDKLYHEGNVRRRQMVDIEGVRSILCVPLISGGQGVGGIVLYRREVSPFSNDDLALVQSFAAQAVIAIENARQFRELQTRLEREAATREILSVISRSRDNDQPVFDVILENAARLCDAQQAYATMVNADRTALEFKGAKGDSFVDFVDYIKENPLPMDPELTATARAMLECRTITYSDYREGSESAVGSRPASAAINLAGVRSLVVVPLISEGVGIGALTIWRKEIRPFAPDQITLVETFAAQAVIAIENVRQFKAVMEARDDAEAALSDLKKAQERLIQAEKMASLGHLTAGIAHEIKNPLNFVNNFAKLSGELVVELGEILEEPIAALGEEDREDAEDLFATVRENLDKINQHGRRADGIVKNMLLHSREGPSQRGTARVNSIAKEALNLAYHGARAENSNFNIEMKTDLAEDVGAIECYPQDLMRVFLNIISNGMYAAYKRGQEEEGFVPEITVSSRLNGDRVEVDVRDNGPGIPEETRKKIFTPFFTTKPAGEGTGLGLSLSYDIVVKQHGGDLAFDSEPGQFTVFKVSLPRALPVEHGGG